MTTRPRKPGLWSAALFAAAALWVGVSGTPAPAAERPSVFTFSGPVRGIVTAAGIKEFLGIPYAAPPTGNRRWRPPQPHAPWFAPRDASAFGNHCPQGVSPFGVPSTTEDCLFLNVFAPAGGAFGHRPVMLWIHGGALVVGESDDYDPTLLVQDGVVVVTINYRLGVLGFLADKAFAAEKSDPDRDGDSDTGSTGNYGLMDQQAALRWVRQNIAFFGGDPDNVTIFGESAGGLSVFSQLASPAAKGLFDKAIVESGSYALNTQSLQTAETAADAFAAAVGCTASTAAATASCLRGVPVATLVAKENAGGYTPNIDGEFLPLSLAQAFASGNFNRVPAIIGTNHDEWRLFVAFDFDLVGMPVGNSQAGFNAAIATDGIVNPTLLAAVDMAYPVNPMDPAHLGAIAYGAAGTDLIFACPSLTADQSISKFVPVFAYEFNDENAPQDFLPTDPNLGPLGYGAAHASEIQYIFNTVVTVPRPALSSDQLSLSRMMQRYWANFAKFGTPNSATVPNWERFSTAEGNMQSLVPPTGMTGGPTEKLDFATAHQCALWAPVLSAEGVTVP